MTRQPPDNKPTENALDEPNTPDIDPSALLLETITHTAVQLHQISLQLHAVIEKATNPRKR